MSITKNDEEKKGLLISLNASSAGISRIINVGIYLGRAEALSAKVPRIDDYWRSQFLVDATSTNLNTI